jgi:hypothetical protein
VGGAAPDHGRRRQLRRPADAAGGGRDVIVRIMIIAAVAIFLVAWVRAVMDVYRRTDLTRSMKAAWAIVMLVLPVVGILTYTLVRPAPQRR